MTILHTGRRAAVALACALIAAPAAFAETSSGDTAWVLTATALVLLMTLPALALFYGGLVQSKNVLSVLSQCVVIACLMSVLWLAFGYSIAFGDGGDANAIWGGLGKSFLNGVEATSETGTIPESVFFMFQMTFAIITPALIVGAYPERTGFAFVLIFSALWMLLVYAPVAHWVWGSGGWLFEQGVRDFAGGLVVHATAGSSAIVIALLVGKRKHFPHEMRPPHSPVFVMIGAALLWVGWYGFNAGSALSAGHGAANAMIVTHISASAAALTWMAIEWIKFGRPGLVGTVTGLIAGLATITPAAGSVGPVGALIIGVSASVICFYAVMLIRNMLKIDDSLDVFAVHGVGGILGTLILPFLAALGPLSPGLGDVSIGQQLWVQVQGVVVVIAWSVGLTLVIAKVTGLVVKIRVKHEAEVEGLDMHVHGERGYHGMN
ncbi:MAG: ammonium transporter [Sphingomonadales bacterium]|nr:MAG: ammonium transporter [Sphingomonadales bacterium]